MSNGESAFCGQEHSTRETERWELDHVNSENGENCSIGMSLWCLCQFRGLLRECWRWMALLLWEGSGGCPQSLSEEVVREDEAGGD